MLNNKEKLDSLTSLRFFAAAMIVIGHAHYLFGSAGMATTFSLCQGVSFFFVLSGFILAYNYPILNSKDNILHFYKARFARIWPAHITAILFFVIMSGQTNTVNLSTIQTIIAAIANISLTQAWIPLNDYYLSFNGVAWSISTEFFFYLLFPFLIHKIRYHRIWTFTILFSIVLVFVIIGWLAHIPSNEAESGLSLMGLLYTNPLVRIFEFSIGILACLIFSQIKHKKLRYSGNVFTLIEISVISITIFSLWLSPRLINFISWHSPLANVVSYYLLKSGSIFPFFLLILIFSLGRGSISKLLKRKPFVFLGEISFALYLVHMTVLNWFYSHADRFFGELPLGQIYFLYWCIILLCAYLLHILIEKPCRKIILGYPLIATSEIIRPLIISKQLAHWSLAILVIYTALFWSPTQAISDGDLNKFKSSPYQNIAHFSNVATLQSMQVQTEGAYVSVHMLWKAIHIAKKTKIALHVLDKKNNMVWQKDFYIFNATKLKQDEYWIEKIKIPTLFIKKNGYKLGVAMYVDPNYLFPVQAPLSDWGGLRATLMVSEFEQILVGSKVA